MAVRRWTRLTPEEHARRRGLFRLIVIIQYGGLMFSTLAVAVGGLVTGSPIVILSSLGPTLAAGMCGLAYRWSRRNWYAAVYFYLAVSLSVTTMGVYALGGAQGPMGVFFLWVILMGGMLVDLRAAGEMAVLSILLYGLFAIGVPLGWMKLPLGFYSFVAAYTFPVFFVLMFVLMALLTRLFAGSLNAALDRARQLTHSLEDEARQRADANRQLTDTNLQLRDLAGRLQRRAVQLQAAVEVSSTIAQVMNPDELLARVVELIRQRFGFYYVGLFLLDEQKRYAVLQQGTGEAGRTMKERGYRLQVSSQSMVGWVCANQKARIALDVGDEPVRFADPLLPDTRSEMALPLGLGERMMGALDVQSAQAAAFDENDMAALQAIADQIAVALENARLFQQSRATLQELDATNRLLALEGWQGYLEQSQGRRRAEFRKAAASGVQPPSEPLVVPIQLRGQSLGRLTLRREGDRAWSDEEIEMIHAIALQTSLSADNARLIEQTRQALGEARALYETSREITSAGEMSEVLSAVLDDLARTGIHAAAIALFDAPTREQAQYIELAGAWDYAGPPRLAPGARFAIADFALFDRITSEGTLVSADLLTDPGLDDKAKTVLGGLGLRGMAITPLVARNQWIGLLFAFTEQAHTFTWAELNFHRALADLAAVAIDNRRLLAETRQRAHREALIRQIATRIRAASDIQGVLETTAAELARSLGASRAIVRLTVSEDERTQ